MVGIESVIGEGEAAELHRLLSELNGGDARGGNVGIEWFELT